MIDLSLLDEVSTAKSTKPTNYETVLYLFFDKGISWEDFKKLPLPYIFSVLKAYHYFKEEEQRELNKRR